MNALKRFTLAIVLAVSIGIVASQDVKAEITNYPNGLSSWGLPVLPGIGGNIFADVNVYWVDSGDSENADGAGGGTAEQPFATIDFAVGQCVANQGDVILVKPGHTETVTAAAGLDLDVAGITVIGIGNGADRPNVNFTTVVGADMDVDAASITVVNILFTGGIDALTGPIDINTADFSLINCEYRDVTGQTTDCIVIADAADRLLIDGYTHRGAAADGADSAILFVPVAAGGIEDAVIRNFNIYGNFDTGAIENTTGGIIRYSFGGGSGWNYIWTEGSEDLCISLFATATGFIGPNIAARLQDNAANLLNAFQSADGQFMAPIQIVNADGERSTETTQVQSSD